MGDPFILRSFAHTRPAASLRITCGFILLLVLSCSPEPPATMHDDLGRPVAVPKKVARVVTLAPNLTEIVFALGSGERLVGTDDFSDEPAAAKALPKVGGMQPNVEKIVALRPDLVLATTNGNHPNLAPALAAVHIPLFVVRTDRLDDVARSMATVAGILHSPRPEAPQELRAAIAAQRRRRSHPPRVLFAVWTDPLYVAGRETFSDDLLQLAGAANIVKSKGWPQYSLESLVASPPEVILYPDKSVSRGQVERLLSVAPSLGRVKAIAVDENLFTRPGPRVALAAAELNRVLDESAPR